MVPEIRTLLWKQFGANIVTSENAIVMCPDILRMPVTNFAMGPTLPFFTWITILRRIP